MVKSCPSCKQWEVKPLTSKQLGLYLLSNTTSAPFCSSFAQTAFIQAHSSCAHAHCDNVSLDQLNFHHVKCGQLMAKLSQPMIPCKAKEEWYLMTGCWCLVTRKCRYFLQLSLLLPHTSLRTVGTGEASTPLPRCSLSLLTL